jgi:hypothetical protein
MILAPQPQTGHVVTGDIDGSVAAGLDLDAYGVERFFRHKLISFFSSPLSQTAKRFKFKE